MLHVCQLTLLLFAILWTATEIPSAPDAQPIAAGPEWRRTSEGWVKVGSLGASALTVANPQPAANPTLHPAAVAGFLFCVGVLSLVLCERPSDMSSPVGPTEISGHQPRQSSAHR